jgi:hypothetical protein
MKLSKLKSSNFKSRQKQGDSTPKAARLYDMDCSLSIECCRFPSKESGESRIDYDSKLPWKKRRVVPLGRTEKRL